MYIVTHREELGWGGPQQVDVISMALEYVQ